MRLVLASASPRRRDLLLQAGFTFRVHVAGIDESRLAAEAPINYVRRLALEKAQAVFAQLAQIARSMQTPSLRSGTTPTESAALQSFGSTSAQSIEEKGMGSFGGAGLQPRRPSLPEGWAFVPEGSPVVLGADTTVVLDGAIMNKPVNRVDAERMLRTLSGRTHHVHTGLALVSAAGNRTHVETTDVTFRAIEDEELEAYLASGDPLDKAGAYGIQGYAARWIPRIAGDYFNVVGLPIAALVNLLESMPCPPA